MQTISKQIIEQAQAGDHEAFFALYQEWQLQKLTGKNDYKEKIRSEDKIMQIVKVGVKAAIALATGIFLPSGDVLYRIAIGAIAYYVLLTYYMWYMKRRGGGFSVFVGEGGFIATEGVSNFVFLLFNPIVEVGCGQSPQSLVNTGRYGNY